MKTINADWNRIQDDGSLSTLVETPFYVKVGERVLVRDGGDYVEADVTDIKKGITGYLIWLKPDWTTQYDTYGINEWENEGGQ
jgi:hypothetical protein